MKKNFFFEDQELQKLYSKGVLPNKRVLKEKGTYILLLFAFIFFDSLIKFIHFSFFVPGCNSEGASNLIVKFVLALTLFGLYYFIQSYRISYLKNLMFADILYFCFSVVSLVLFIETEISIWQRFPGETEYFSEGLKVSLIEFTFLFSFFNWKVKMFSVVCIGCYIIARIGPSLSFSVVCNVFLFVSVLLMILSEERNKRISFMRLNEGLKELTKEKTVNSRITLINEKERSAISDKILDNIQEGVLVIDIDKNIIKMNESLIKIFKDYNVEIDEIVPEMLNATIVTFLEAPDFILNVVSPSNQHISSAAKIKICNHKEKSDNFKKAKARTSHIFHHLDIANRLTPNKYVASRTKLDNDLYTKINEKSNQSQCSSKNQGLNMPVNKAIDLLGEKAVFYEEKENDRELMTVPKNEDNYRVNCDVFFESIFERNKSQNKEISKYKYHLHIATTSFRDELRFILILREKRSEIENRHLLLQNENKTKTLSFVSHEMRTPLNCIVGMLTVLEQTIEPSLVDKYVAPANACGKHLMNLLNDLLDAAQIQAGKFKLVFTEFDLKSLLSDALFMLKIQAKAKGLQLVLEWDNNLSHFIKSDPNRLRQIVLNLLGNAMKFTQKGSIRIITEKNPKNNLLVHIRILDTGLGIKDDSKKKLFTAFGKLDQDENEYLNSQGVGLGLLISNILAKNIGPSVKTLVESDIAMNQGLNVLSEFGKGTEFEFIVENKNETDLMDEADVELDISELNSKIKQEQVYFLRLNSLKSNTISRKMKKASIPSQRYESEIDLGKGSVRVLETDPMSSSKSSSDQKPLSEKGAQNNIRIKRNISKSKEEIESGKSLYYLNNDLDQKTMKTQNELSDLVFARGSKSFTRNLNDITDNEEKIHILSELNIEKRCECPDILICDDSEFNILVLRAMLEVYNFRVEAAYNGEEAINKVIDHFRNSNCCKLHKLIFMDIEMPIKDGYECSREIIDFFKDNDVECPGIVATTGHNTNKQNKRIIEAGIDDVLVKPILKAPLVDMIARKLFTLEKYSSTLYPGNCLGKVSDKIMEIR